MPDQKSSNKSKRKNVDASKLKGRRFGRVLTKLGIINRDQVHEALAIQKVAKKKATKKKATKKKAAKKKATKKKATKKKAAKKKARRR